MLFSVDTTARGRFSEKRCGPSRRCARNASAALENSFVTPKRLFRQHRSKAEVLASQGDVNFGLHSGHCSTRSARGKDPSSTEPQIRRLQGMLVEPIRLFCPTGKSLRVLPVGLSSP